MSKLVPKNREEAFAYQFQGDVKMLLALSKFRKKEFKRRLDLLKIHISTYEKMSKT